MADDPINTPVGCHTQAIRTLYSLSANEVAAGMTYAKLDL